MHKISSVAIILKGLLKLQIQTFFNFSISHFVLEILDMQMMTCAGLQTAFVNFRDLEADALHWQQLF